MGYFGQQLGSWGPNQLIAVMGTTGVGKSHFISQATGNTLDIGYGLEPTTLTIQQHVFTGSNPNVILADTPGFDSDYKLDIDLLEEFIEFLKGISSRGIYLSGIIYLHRITDNKMTGPAQKSLNLLTALCGDGFFKHVVLVTTMWDDVYNKDIAVKREEYLKTKFWKELIGKGARPARFDGSKDSAIEIVNSLVNEPSPDSVIPDIYQESIKDRKPLSETRAGGLALNDLRIERERLGHHLHGFQQEQELTEGHGYQYNQRHIEQDKQIQQDIQQKMERLREAEVRYTINSSDRLQSGERSMLDPPLVEGQESPMNYHQPNPNWNRGSHTTREQDGMQRIHEYGPPSFRHDLPGHMPQDLHVRFNPSSNPGMESSTPTHQNELDLQLNRSNPTSQTSDYPREQRNAESQGNLFFRGRAW